MLNRSVNHIIFDFTEKNGKHYAAVSFKKVKDISYLPTTAEIESEIADFIATLKIKKIDPAIITVCRSHISGYCPSDHCGLIERLLTKELVGAFGAKVFS